MSHDRVTRRLFIAGTSSLVVLGAGGCKKGSPSSCADTTGLSPDDIELRKNMEYSDSSALAAQTCEQCQQWLEAPSSDQCGTCKVMKGPIHPHGYCKLFVAKG